ncbi:MAG: cell wall hydrolase, partial [Ruminococcaceae bacterium]|nr:cell wall hydrolase [Oscillospiraceae bacterium]
SAVTIRQKKASDLKNRLAMADAQEGTLLVSIHQNIFSDGSAVGTQVFYGGKNEASALLAESIQRQVCRLLQPQNTRQIKQVGKEIYLLYHTRNPAVMVECGFLSNDAERAKLCDPEYQKQMAFSVFCGILEFLQQCEGM